MVHDYPGHPPRHKNAEGDDGIKLKGVRYFRGLRKYMPSGSSLCF